MLDNAINPIKAIAREFEAADKAERTALAAVVAADGTPDFAEREAEYERRSSVTIEIADRMLDCPSRGFPDILRKVRVLASIYRDGSGVIFSGGEEIEIGGAEPYDGHGLDIRAVDAIMRDLLRLAA